MPPNGLDPIYKALEGEMAEKRAGTLTERDLLILNLMEIRSLRSDLRQPFWSAWTRKQIITIFTVATAVLMAGNAGAATLLDQVVNQVVK